MIFNSVPMDTPIIDIKRTNNISYKVKENSPLNNLDIMIPVNAPRAKIIVRFIVSFPAMDTLLEK